MSTHHEPDPSVQRALDAYASRFNAPDREDEHDRKTVSDRAAALVAWAESSHAELERIRLESPPPEGDRHAPSVSVEVEREVFDALRLTGRPGWRFMEEAGAWMFLPDFKGSMVQVKRRVRP